MTYLNVSLAFIEESNASIKLTFGQDRVNDITGKPEFTTPDPTLIVSAQWNSDLNDAIIAADGGGDAEKDALKNVVTGWDDNFRKLGKYVETIANKAASLGDAIDIVNVSGYKYNKLDRTPAVAPDQPIINGRQLAQAGAVEITGDKPDGTVNMITIASANSDFTVQVINSQLKFTGANDLRIVNHTRGNVKMIDLESAVRYFVKRIAFNTAGASAISPTLSIVAP